MNLRDIQPRHGSRSLSPRHIQIVRLLAKGHCYKQIARLLGCQHNTVKAHMRILYERLDVHNAAAAVAECMRRGLLDEAPQKLSRVA